MFLQRHIQSSRIGLPSGKKSSTNNSMANIRPLTDAVLAAVQQPRPLPLQGGKEFFLRTGPKLRLVSTIKHGAEKTAVFCQDARRNQVRFQTAWDANHAVLWDPKNRQVTRLRPVGRRYITTTRLLVPVGKAFPYLTI